jgi:hypothetical protein
MGGEEGCGESVKSNAVTDQSNLAIIPPDFYERPIRLEAIFMPHSRRQRDAMHGTERSPLRFVHYTSADAALKIIATKRLWMRNAVCMSDFMEVQHGFGILSKYFSDKTRHAPLVAAIEEIAPGATQSGIGLFDQWWHDTRFGTYIVSVSEHDATEDLHGRLSMWRAFGGNAARVAIVFNIPWLTGAGRALSLLFSPVSYLREDDVHRNFEEVSENILANADFLRSLGNDAIVQWIFSMLLVNVTCLKHEGFHEEREWRGIYSPKRLFSPLMEQSTEVISGVPQIVHKLPLDSAAAPELADLDLSRIFDRLIIGPTQYPMAIREAFVGALTNLGVASPHERIFISGIPIRA